MQAIINCWNGVRLHQNNLSCSMHVYAESLVIIGFRNNKSYLGSLVTGFMISNSKSSFSLLSTLSLRLKEIYLRC